MTLYGFSIVWKGKPLSDHWGHRDPFAVILCQVWQHHRRTCNNTHSFIAPSVYLRDLCGEN